MAVYSIALCLSLILVLQMAAARPSMDAGSRSSFPHLSQMHVDRTQSEEGDNGTTWAILVAGSQGIGNYRHQADVCHAYQILKRGGLKDENIVVFLYDDIANDALNPKPGVIINRPNGDDVYAGVPKDYTGEAVSQENLFAVILGNQSAVTGGSGKVVNSTSNDRIFIFYSDHGGPGALGMPFSFLYAVDLVDVLKKKHASGTYKEMVIYIESCESGSIFEGLLPENLNIYAMTASQANEDSYATYCRWEDFPCLGDLYSVAWMEYSESHNLMNKTISQQYEKVKERTSRNHTYYSGSHVMEYGNESIKVEKLYLYHGFDPSTKKIPADETESHGLQDVVDQRSADLSFLWSRVELLKEITSTVLHRQHLDGSLDNIGTSLFGPKQSSSILKGIRKPGMSIVDDWECLKSSVRIFETNCGALTQYGMKHMRAFANVCNSGVKKAAMEEACKAACNGHHLGQRNPAKHGFNA